jgi:hypothetical protein
MNRPEASRFGEAARAGAVRKVSMSSAWVLLRSIHQFDNVVDAPLGKRSDHGIVLVYDPLTARGFMPGHRLAGLCPVPDPAETKAYRHVLLADLLPGKQLSSDDHAANGVDDFADRFFTLTRRSRLGHPSPFRIWIDNWILSVDPTSSHSAVCYQQAMPVKR